MTLSFTDWLTDVYFCHTKSNPRNLWVLRHLIRQIFRFFRFKNMRNDKIPWIRNVAINVRNDQIFWLRKVSIFVTDRQTDTSPLYIYHYHHRHYNHHHHRLIVSGCVSWKQRKLAESIFTTSSSPMISLMDERGWWWSALEASWVSTQPIVQCFESAAGSWFVSANKGNVSKTVSRNKLLPKLNFAMLTFPSKHFWRSNEYIFMIPIDP